MNEQSVRKISPNFYGIYSISFGVKNMTFYSNNYSIFVNCSQAFSGVTLDAAFPKIPIFHWLDLMHSILI